MGKRKLLDDSAEPNEINLPAKYLATSHARANERRLIVILDGAQLEIVKVIVKPNLSEAWFSSHVHSSPLYRTLN